MDEHEPVGFGSLGPPTPEPSVAVERRPELHAVARKVIAILEPLDPPARLRVIRAAAILLELDGANLGLYP
jgi:hypothetical protein